MLKSIGRKTIYFSTFRVIQITNLSRHALMTPSSFFGGTWGRNAVAIRGHTPKKFEEVTARGKDEGCVFGDDRFVGLHGPCEFIERHSFRALVVSLRVDFSGIRVRHAAHLLDLPVGFRLDFVQVTHTISAYSGGFAVTFRQKALRD